MNKSGYTGLGLMAIGGLILYFGFNDPVHSITFILLCAVPIGIGYYLLKTAIIEYEPDTEVSTKQWQRDLKASGIALTVEFDKCKLITNQYREEVEKGYGAMSESVAMDSLMGLEEPDYHDIDQSVLVYEVTIKGQSMTFYSPPINKEKVSLQLLLGIQKTTTLYVDPNDVDNYYFDLDFIRN